MSQHAHLSEPDPEFAAFLAQHGNTLPDFAKLDVQTMRSQMSAVAGAIIKKNLESSLPNASQYSVENHTIEVEGGTIAVRTITPTPTPEELALSADVTFPVMVWFHGGGFVLGDLELDDYSLKIQSVEMRAVMINVDYRLAPEHPFPTGVNDCYTAIKWAAANAARFRGSVSKGFIVGGASAGGNLAAAAVHRSLRDPFFPDNKVKITGNLIQVPALVHPQAYPEQYKTELLSFEQNKDAPSLGKDALNMFYGLLGGSPSDPDLSPFLADHVGLPATYIQVCGLDPLRDEALLYGKLLPESGVPTRVDVYPGLPHGFHVSFGHFAAAKKWQEDFLKGFHWLLENPGKA